jgi:quercetin dioxygenase-like cupin family protein
MPYLMDESQSAAADSDSEYRARRGDVMINEVTRERALVLLGPGDGHGDRLCVHLTLQPRGAVAAEHLHPHIDERFRVLAGRLRLRLDGDESELGPGDEAAVPAGTWHEWRNDGDTAAQVIVDVVPGQRFAQMSANGYGLANAGNTNERGMPSLLQLSLMAPEFADVVAFRRPPSWLRHVLFALLAPIARARGLRSRYPERFEAPHSREAPDPALLGYVEGLPPGG